MKVFSLEHQEIIFDLPKNSDVPLATLFFREVIEHTFEKNGLGDEKQMIEDEIQEKKERLLEAIQTQGQAHYLILGKLEDEIICSIGIGKTGYLIEKCTKGEILDTPEICTVFVKPAFQAKGISAHLFELALEELKRRGHTQFCMDSGYKTAQKIWRKKLGEPSYFIKDFWAEGSHHMIWCCPVQ